MEVLMFVLIKRILVVVGIILMVVLFLLTYSIMIYTGEMMIQFGAIDLDMNENYYSGLITVIASIVAISLPLSISVITQSKEENFNSKEMADSFYRERRYKRIKWSIIPLMILVILSYFKTLTLFIVLPTTILTIYVIYQFYKYMDVVESYVSDFAGMVISQEKRKIDEIF